MASETAPSFNTAIFNQSNFNTSGSDALDYAYLASHYLQYPTGQSAVETIYDLVVSNSGVNNNLEIGSSPLITAGIGGFTTSSVNKETRTALGKNALIVSSATNGQYNTAVGSQALEANTTGDDNTAIGYLSQHTPTTGIANTSVGVSTLQTATTSVNYNTALGYQSLDDVSTGDTNTCIGRNSGGSITTGQLNTAIGRGAFSSANRTGTIAIGNDAEPTADYQIMLGDTTNPTNLYIPKLKPQQTTLSTNTAEIGSRTDYTLTTGNITVGTTMTTVSSFSLPAGAWIISAWGEMNQTVATSGYYVLTIAFASAAIGIHTSSAYINTALATVVAEVSVSGLFNLSSTQTIYINAKSPSAGGYFTSGDDNNAIFAIRVA